MKKIMRTLFVALMVVLLIVPSLAVSAETADVPPNPVPAAKAGAGSSGAASKAFPYEKMVKSITDTKKINKDTKGWLSVPNTNMNMPIVQGKDNTYYEKRMLDGTNLPNNNYKNYEITATYMDYRVKLGKTWEDSSNNIVLYGHNWNNLKDPLAIGNYPYYTMFAQLPSYTDLTFAKENPYIYFSTGDMEGIWKVFAAGYCEADSKLFPYNSPNINGKRVQELANDWKQRSLHTYDVDVNSNDQLLTLATCTRVYGKGIGAGQTYAVVARRLRPDENETQPVNIVLNPNVKQPDFSTVSK